MTTAVFDPTAAMERVRKMADTIVARFKPERLILFGSYARGTAGPDSDADFLVVMRPSGTKRQATIEIGAALAHAGLAKDIVVATPDEVDMLRNTPGTIIAPALAEGVVMYERAA